MSKDEKATVDPQVAAPGTGYLAGYSLLYSPADLAALTAATIKDFRIGLNYYTARRVGSVTIGNDTQTPPQPIWEDRFELVLRVVKEYTINPDLFDFQMYLKRGNAYSPTYVPPTLLLAEGASSKKGKDDFYEKLNEAENDRQRLAMGGYPMYMGGIVLEETDTDVAVSEADAVKNIAKETQKKAPEKKNGNGNGGHNKK